MEYIVPHGETYEIDTIVLDLNGTLSVNGEIPEGVKERFNKLIELKFRIILFTGDQRGTAAKLAKDLGIECIITQTGKDKEINMLKLNSEKCAAIGNARIDIATFKHAKISILTLQAEGIHAKTISHADIIVPSIINALDLFINKNSLCATLRE